MVLNDYVKGWLGTSLILHGKNEVATRIGLGVQNIQILS